MKPRLTFKNGKFKLTGVNLINDESWEMSESKYVTTDIKAAARLRRFADKYARKVLNRAFVKYYSPDIAPLPPFLDRHQVDGVRWILTRSRSYLAHAPGAGKTLQALLAAARCPGPGSAVFVVPPSLTANWEREAAHWLPKLNANRHYWPTIAIVGDSASQSTTGWAAEYLIVPDSMLARAWVLDRLLKLEKRFIAVDEASRFKEVEAERTRALFGGTLKDGRKSTGLVYDCRHAVLLDGSPMPNRPMELWAPTFAMSPESIDFLDETEFGFRYCGAQMNNFGRWEFKHSSRESELHKRLRKSFMHVVTENELSHPERLRTILPMTDDARSPAHRKWEKQEQRIDSAAFTKVNELDSQGKMATFRAELGMRKAPWVANYVADRLANKDESILLFCWHRDVAYDLEYRLRKYNPGLVIGGTTETERERIFSDFQSGQRKLVIGNILAMGRGHNLQRADRVIFAEFSWTDELNKQCEKRASRRGNLKRFTRCEYIVSPGSFDETILNSVFRKEGRVKRIIG